MASRTLQYLMDRVRELGRYEDPFITDPELLVYANSEISDFRQELLSFDESRILDTDTVSVVSGTASYDLPAGCNTPIAVVVPDASSGSGFYRLTRINWRDRYELGKGSSSMKAAHYCIRGRKIWFWPTPSWTDLATIDFLSTFTDLTAVDSFDPGLDGWDKRVFFGMLVLCAAKGRDETKHWESLRDAALKRMAWSARADRAAPPRASQVTHRAGGGACDDRY